MYYRIQDNNNTPKIKLAIHVSISCNSKWVWQCGMKGSGLTYSALPCSDPVMRISDLPVTPVESAAEFERQNIPLLHCIIQTYKITPATIFECHLRCCMQCLGIIKSGNTSSLELLLSAFLMHYRPPSHLNSPPPRVKNVWGTNISVM